MFIVSDITFCALDKILLHEVFFSVAPGSTHVFMGPNGSGKSSLAFSLMGHPRYKIISGSIIFNGTDITEMSVDKRARLGIFLSLQQPYEIPGVALSALLKESFCAIYGPDQLDLYADRVVTALKLLHIDGSFLQREVHVGFSGGEKKRCEMLQLLVLQPKIAILDEIDSGLDVDALKIVIAGLQAFKKMCPESSLLLITHYTRLLEHIVPDAVSLIKNGTLKTGGLEIIKQIEQYGYQDHIIHEKTI